MGCFDYAQHDKMYYTKEKQRLNSPFDRGFLTKRQRKSEI